MVTWSQGLGRLPAPSHWVPPARGLTSALRSDAEACVLGFPGVGHRGPLQAGLHLPKPVTHTLKMRLPQSVCGVPSRFGAKRLTPSREKEKDQAPCLSGFF